MSLIQAFTIVDRRTSEPYTLRVRARLAVVSFHSSRNAQYVALALEAREALGKHSQEPYALFSLGDERDDEDPKHHYTQAYEDFGTLLEDCKLRECDTMFITDLETPPNELIEFYGELFCTDE